MKIFMKVVGTTIIALVIKKIFPQMLIVKIQ